MTEEICPKIALFKGKESRKIKNGLVNNNYDKYKITLF